MFSYLVSKYNFDKVKHLNLSNVIFYPCQYTNEKFYPRLNSAGLEAVEVAMGQDTRRIFGLPLPVSFHHYSIFIFMSDEMYT